MREIVYDDFTGGHFVGSINTNQPRTTWTGANVICTADEGFLMATPGWERSNLVASGVSLPITQPVMYLDPTLLPQQSRAVWTIKNNTGSQAWRADVDTAWPAVTPGVSTQFTQTALDTAVTSTGQVVFARTGGVLVWNPSTPGAPTAVSVPYSTSVAQWGEFTLAWSGFESNRIHFSDPADPTVWPATSFITVGRPGSHIVAVVPAGDVLYVGLRGEGWWSITGVLGQTATKRRVNGVGPGGNAVETQRGIVAAGSYGNGLWLVRGGSVDKFFQYPVDQLDRSFATFGTAGSHFVMANRSDVFVWADVERRWRRMLMPAGYFFHLPFDDTSSSPNLYVLSYTTTGTAVYLHRTPREPVQPTVTNGRFDQATVKLASFTNPTPYRVHEILVELDFGTPSNQTAIRSLSCRVETSNAVDMPSTYATVNGAPSLPGSSTFTREWGGAHTTVNGHRETVRFSVSDAPVTHSAAPVLTMAGVKIRRVVLRYELV